MSGDTVLADHSHVARLDHDNWLHDKKNLWVPIFSSTLPVEIKKNLISWLRRVLLWHMTQFWSLGMDSPALSLKMIRSSMGLSATDASLIEVSLVSNCFFPILGIAKQLKLILETTSASKNYLLIFLNLSN